MEPIPVNPHGVPNQRMADSLEPSNIPNEILAKILGFTDGPDRQKASLVSKRWKHVTVMAAQQEEWGRLKSFLDSFVDHIPDPKIRGEIGGAVRAATVFSATNKKEIKESLLHLKRELAKRLSQLSPGELNGVRARAGGAPPLFENLFSMAEAYYAITHKPNTSIKEINDAIDTLLVCGVEPLEINGYVNALEQLFNYNAAIHLISKLVARGDLNAVWAIAEVDDTDEFKEDLYKIFTEFGYYEQAFSVIVMMDENDEHIGRLLEKMMKKPRFSDEEVAQAIRFIKGMDGTLVKLDALEDLELKTHNVSPIFALKRAVVFAMSRPDSKIDKLCRLHNTCPKSETAAIEHEILSTLPKIENPYLRAQTYNEIFDLGHIGGDLLSGLLSQAWENTKPLIHPERKGIALYNIVKGYVNLSDLERAALVANEIPEGSQKNLALELIEKARLNPSKAGDKRKRG